MSDQTFESWQKRLQESAQALAYPPTPDIAAVVTNRLTQTHPRWTGPSRRMVWSAALIILLGFAALISVPGVRAAVLEFLQFGAIRIFLEAPSPTPTPFSTSATAPSAINLTPQPSPRSTPVPIDLVSLLDLAGGTTFDDAREHAGFVLFLPSYPEGLGLPQRVFLQDMDGAVVVFAWLEADNSDKVRLSLFQIGPGSWAGEKGLPKLVEHTHVNGEPALWTQGPYPLVLKSKGLEFRRLVDGNVLIWSDNGITYRLEGQLSLSEAVKIAESLAPIP